VPRDEEEQDLRILPLEPIARIWGKEMKLKRKVELEKGGTKGKKKDRRKKGGGREGTEKKLRCYILYFILFYSILFYSILFYFILFYFILFYFILFYFIFVFIFYTAAFSILYLM